MTSILDVLRLTTETGTNILGNGLRIAITRGATRDDGVTDDLGPGTLDVTIRDATLSPQVNNQLRPKRRLILSAYSEGSWQSLMTARVDKAATITTGKRTATVDVTVTALDAVNKLANYDVAAQAVNGRLDQRLNPFLASSGVTWFGFDTTAPATPAVPVSPASTRSALEWVTIVRDTVHGYAFVDSDDVLQVIHPSAAPSSVPDGTGGRILSDLAADVTAPGATGISYVDIDYDYDTEQLTNVLTINRINLADPDGAKEYGPYRATESVNTWGEKSDDVTVTDGTPSDHANYFLSYATQPTDLVRSVTFNVDPNNTRSLNAGLIQLYKPVRIKHRGHDRVYRVIGVKHDITAKRWRCTYITRPLETATAITLGTPAAGPNTGPDDITGPTPTVHASRYRSTNLALTNNTATTVAFDAFTIQHGTLAYDATNRWFTAGNAGLYLINVALAFAGSATGYRNAAIQVNAVTKRLASVANAGTGVGVTVPLSAVIRVAANDRISVTALHTAGADLNLLAGVGATAIDVTYLGV